MAIRTFRWCLFIDDHRLLRDHARLLVALIAGHVRVASLQGEMGSRVVVERRRNPALCIVTIRASGLPGFHKLAGMRIFVTILTNLRRALELHFLRPHRHFVAITALHRAVRAEQREFRFRMVEAVDVRPGPHIVAGFAAQGRAVCAAPRHAVLEFAVVHVDVTGRAGPILEMERQDFVLPSGGTDFVTIGARHGRVSAGQRETSVAMLGDRKCGAVEVQNSMAIFAFVSVRSGGELAVMGIFVAIRARREFHLIDGVLARGQMAFVTFHGDVFPLQGVIGSVVLLHAEQ